MVFYIRLREALRDYTRRLMREAHETGCPVIRPLFFDFPADARAWEVQDAFMFGPDLLAAPVCHAGETSRRVYLPEGHEWTDAWTGLRLPGGTFAETAAPIDRIPLFLRDGQQSWLVSRLARNASALPQDP